MRIAVLLLCSLGALAAHAQRLDPDQQPYWTRYTFVEDSADLVPLQGDYRVYYLSSGMWWTMMTPVYPIKDLPEASIRMRPLFVTGLPAFSATPARGVDAPEVRLVVVRQQDTMVVELSTYWSPMPYRPDDRCKRTDCTRRPPVIMPFRPGRYIANGSRYGPDAGALRDARTEELTDRFDVLWGKAMKNARVIPQLNTDTCRQVVYLPPALEHPETAMRDAWLLRSPYCGKHFVHFPFWGSGSTYKITFVPYLLDQKKDPVLLDTSPLDDVNYWLDVSDWPIGDHPVEVTGTDSSATFILKLR